MAREINKESFSRKEVLELLDDLAFHISDNGIIEDDDENGLGVKSWFENRYPTTKGKK